MVKLVIYCCALCRLSSAVSLLHRVVHCSDRDILWGAFWPKIVLMALVRYKEFVHKNRACSNIKNKTTLPTKSCNILQIRLDNIRGIYTRVNNCGDRIQEIVCMSVCERVTSVNFDQWTVSSNWSRNQIRVDQGEFDLFVDIYLETDQNDPKINQNDP